MKYLVLLAIVMAVIWFLRHNRGGGERRDDAPEPGAPQDMVRCPVCSVHLPRSDALPGPDGQLYCCAAHRSRAAGD